MVRLRGPINLPSPLCLCVTFLGLCLLGLEIGLRLGLVLVVFHHHDFVFFVKTAMAVIRNGVDCYKYRASRVYDREYWSGARYWCIMYSVYILQIFLLKFNPRSLLEKNSYTKPWGGGGQSDPPPLLLSTQFILLTWNLVHITSVLCTFN